MTNSWERAREEGGERREERKGQMLCSKSPFIKQTTFLFPSATLSKGLCWAVIDWRAGHSPCLAESIKAIPAFTGDGFLALMDRDQAGSLQDSLEPNVPQGMGSACCCFFALIQKAESKIWWVQGHLSYIVNFRLFWSTEQGPHPSQKTNNKSKRF